MFIEMLYVFIMFFKIVIIFVKLEGEFDLEMLIIKVKLMVFFV